MKTIRFTLHFLSSFFTITAIILLISVSSCSIPDCCEKDEFVFTESEDGKDGIDGQDGIDGENGIDGIDGVDGQDPCFVILKERIVLDFEEFIAGEIVERYEGFEVYGYHSNRKGNHAMIFDSNQNPASGDDDDLNVNLGNILIISEDGDSSDPDDNSRGGELTKVFLGGVDIESMKWVDIEKKGSYVTLYDKNNKPKTFDAPITGDKSYRTQNISMEGVFKMNIVLKTSGGIDDIVLIKCTKVNNCEK